MTNITLLNSDNSLRYSGTYLNLWKPYNIRKIHFNSSNDKYQVTYYDDKNKIWTVIYTPEKFQKLYYNLIIAGWTIKK